MSEADKIIESLKKSGRKVEEFYTGNKGSDKNVANIEDVNELKRLLYSDNLTQYGKRKLVNYYDKRIQELEEENAMLKKASNIAKNINIDDVTQVMNKSYEDFVKNYIPKQVIIDAINENRFEVYTREYGNVEVVSIDVLQELLEGGK